MNRPRPYYVASRDDTTPDEPRIGWYWSFEDDEGEHIRGEYGSRREAEDAIDNFMFQHGEAP